jgi:hypothetical protein
MDRIIILGEEEELVDLANAINTNYCNGGADMSMYNDDKIAEKTVSDRLFLIGHAGPRGIGRYDFKDLTKEFGAHLKGAKTAVYLSGCSTLNEAKQIINSGFIPATLAKNVKEYTGHTVYGTPGVLVLTGRNALSVEVTVGSGYQPTDIFVPA